MKTNQFIKRQGHYMRFITGTVYIFNIHVYTNYRIFGEF